MLLLPCCSPPRRPTRPPCAEDRHRRPDRRSRRGDRPGRLAGGRRASPPGALKCGEMGDATASLMPKRWVPADPNFRIGPKGARYERWEIKACGKSEPFLVVFWKDKKAGPQYQVAHPFPAGPAAKP